MGTERTIRVEALTRVEGEGGLHVRLEGDRVEDVKLSIYEPPRFFEGFLRGRALEEVPDITARICGICPVAYQMTAVHALERALGIPIPEEVRRLRRLLYCGEWIESHGLHMHLLQAPDFFGCASGIELAQKYPQEVSRGLRLKKHGNQLLEVLGGRAIHPVNVAVGGFHRAPSKADLQRLIPDFQWGLDAAIETTKWVASFDYPDFPCEWEMVSLKHDTEYPMNEGRIASSSGKQIEVADYEGEFEEHHVAHSTALHSLRTDQQSSYYVGPLARVSLAFDQLSPSAKRTADTVRFEVPCFNPFRAIIARGLELIHAFEEGLEILKSYEPWAPAREPYDYREAEGCAATEAPRGLIYHRYRIDAHGKIQFAKIVPPTSQNQRQIEKDLAGWIPRVMSHNDQQMSDDCERLIRTYDPCISCSTHFLRLKVERTPASPRVDC
ncbi:MAG: Ni/Fe hydrogenase subunit alpha [Planctomycetaceae bacterium]